MLPTATARRAKRAALSHPSHHHDPHKSTNFKSISTAPYPTPQADFTPWRHSYWLSLSILFPHLFASFDWLIFRLMSTGGICLAKLIWGEAVPLSRFLSAMSAEQSSLDFSVYILLPCNNKYRPVIIFRHTPAPMSINFPSADFIVLSKTPGSAALRYQFQHSGYFQARLFPCYMPRQVDIALRKILFCCFRYHAIAPSVVYSDAATKCRHDAKMRLRSRQSRRAALRYHASARW